MTLRLSLLGAPLVERDGQPVAFDTRKAVALLAYLGVTDRPHRREALAALGWPDADRERASAALRRTLSTIRHAAGTDVLLTAGGTVALNPAAADVDVRHVHLLLEETRGHGHPPTAVCRHCAEPLAEIARLHRGAFLEGFALRDSPEYDDWQFFTAEELQRELADALSRLVEVHVLTGDLELATQAARRRLALDPLHEAAHRMLMQLYAWQGRREAALRQYRECVRVLQSELGVSPLEETTRLSEDVLADRVAPPPSARASAPELASPQAAGAPGPAVPASSQGEGERQRTGGQGSSRGGSLARRLVPASGKGEAGETTRRRPPLVARERELAMLSNAITRMHQDGVVVVVEGEAGIGKTRLLNELVARPVANGRRVLTTVCREDETGLAYGAVVELLRSAVGAEPQTQRWLAELRTDVVREVGRLLPEVAEIAGPALPADGPGAAWRLVDALATALVAAASDGEQPPGVLIVDDVHWIDESSLDVLSHLARRLQGRPVCLVVAWRTELVGRGHRLRRLVTDLARRQLVRQLPLDRLDLVSVRTLLEDALGAAHPDLESLTDQVMETTEGVPLLVIEYLTALVNDPKALQGPPPQGARDLLLARLSAVGPGALQILTTAAVIGRSFDPDLVRRASGRTEEETAEALDELTAAGLIAEPGSDGQGEGERQRAGGRGSGQGEGERQRAGGRGSGYDFTHAHLRALAYQQAGLARQRLLHRRVAAALESRVRHQRADRSLAATIAAHHAAAGEGIAAAAWYARAAEQAAEVLAVSEAVAHYQEALALGHDEPQRIHEALGDLQTLAGRYGQALTAYEAAASLTSDEHFAVIEHKIAGVYLRWGQWVLADQHLAIALATLEDHIGPDAAALRARVLTDRGLVAHRQGHDDAAASLARAALRAASETNDLGALAGAHNLLGVLSKHDLSLARHHLEHALALARRRHDVGIEVAAANNLAQAHAAAGALDRALPLAESALARAGQLADRHREAALRNNLADLLRAAGRNEEAMLHLKRAVTLFAEIGEPDEHAPEIWKLAAW